MPTQSPVRSGRSALLAASMALVVLASVELVLRVASWASDDVAILLSPGLSRTLPDPTLGHRPNPALPEHDAAGWRNASRPQRAAIVAIGDSQTYGDETPLADAWPQRLERRTGRTTYNMALGGYGPVHYARLLDEALVLDPEIVAVGVYAGNDVAEAYGAVHERGLADEWLPDAAGRERLARVDAERGDITAVWKQTRTLRRGHARQAFRDWVAGPLERLRLFGFFRALARLGSGPTPAFASRTRKPFAHYAERVRGLDPNHLLPVELGAASTVLTPAARASALDFSDPRIAEGLRITERALADLASRCSGARRLLVVLIPTKESVYAERVRASGADVPDALARQWDSEAYLWRRLGALLDGVGVETIDALPALRAALDREPPPYPADWNGHPIAAGNDAIARAVSEAIERP
jgi:hypothetical protein